VVLGWRRIGEENDGRARRMTMKQKSICSSGLVQAEETVQIKSIGTAVPVHN
jgi:hypothetical protein